MLAVVIMAAGKGTRMESDLPKVLHEIGGLSLVEHVVQAAQGVGADKIVVIVGHGRELVMAKLARNGVEFAVQDPPMGTGHAVLQAKAALDRFDGNVIILSGDVPLLSQATLRKLMELHENNKSSVTVLSTIAPNPFGYGRIVRDKEGSFVCIVEEKDADDVQRGITEINSGIYCYNSKHLFQALSEVKPNNAKGEYYLTDTIAILRSKGYPIQAVDIADFQEIQGINTQAELKAAETAFLSRKQTV